MLLAKKSIANEAFFITYILPVLLVVSVLGLRGVNISFCEAARLG